MIDAWMEVNSPSKIFSSAFTNVYRFRSVYHVHFHSFSKEREKNPGEDSIARPCLTNSCTRVGSCFPISISRLFCLLRSSYVTPPGGNGRKDKIKFFMLSLDPVSTV